MEREKVRGRSCRRRTDHKLQRHSLIPVGLRPARPDLAPCELRKPPTRSSLLVKPRDSLPLGSLPRGTPPCRLEAAFSQQDVSRNAAISNVEPCARRAKLLFTSNVDQTVASSKTPAPSSSRQSRSKKYPPAYAPNPKIINPFTRNPVTRPAGVFFAAAVATAAAAIAAAATAAACCCCCCSSSPSSRKPSSYEASSSRKPSSYEAASLRKAFLLRDSRLEEAAS